MTRPHDLRSLRFMAGTVLVLVTLLTTLRACAFAQERGWISPIAVFEAKARLALAERDAR